MKWDKEWIYKRLIMFWFNGSLKYMCRWKWMIYILVVFYVDKIEILFDIFSKNFDVRF